MRMKSTIVALGLSILLAGGGLAASAKEMVFVSWGGAYQDAIREAWLKPFTAATGTKVIEETSPETAKIQAMISAGTVSWDIVTDGGLGVARGAQAGLFEEITPEMVDQSGVYPQIVNKYGVPSEVFSTAFAFSTKAFPDGKAQPGSWADFWNVEKFPGARALFGSPQSVLEAALMADGVAQADVYKVLDTKEGQDRAFNKVRELKPHVSLWWTGGAQPVQAIGSGEVVMANGWNGRLQAGITEGVPLKIVWNGAVAEVGYFMMVKGAPHKEEATELLRWIAKPESQAQFHKYVSYGPTMAGAWDFIPKSEWGHLPSSPEIMKQSIFLNVDWWLKNEGAMVERYNALMQE
ncbi:ABC transporter substrate-binding protein [Mesorhizobium sp. INR15]|uniref:ABC transporter substrate-binding protein n=1 Tax=Mesorhizobium sp. INR15 TaxID=2654248 RepID=UPI0018968A59|nr:ABC transporter substrate-binding protein [Mesorhizobium sp. INR15]QPC95505.1 extracellular solute-binding protein [Mesorhizobium sp. INR15]